MLTPKQRRIALGGSMVAIFASLAVVFSSGRTMPLERLVQRLPREGRVLARFDLATLRQAGLLKSAPLAVDGDYKQFIDKTGFNYLEDLDTAILTYGAREAHVLLRGKFDFSKFKRYAEQNGGSCAGSVCRVKGTTPGVTVGFARLDRRTLAVTSSTNPDAIQVLLDDPKVPVPLQAPSQPVWFLVPKAVLAEQILPPAASVFATAALECAPAFLAFGRGGQQMEATLAATCQSGDQATQAVRELEAATTMLTRVVTKETPTPDPTSLSSVLIKGKFSADGNRLRGSWPLDAAFTDALLGTPGAP